MHRDRHPRGTPTWPNWKKALPGTRIEHVRSGATGTFVGVGNPKGNTHAIIDWDDRGFGPTRGNCVSPAFDLRPTGEVIEPEGLQYQLGSIPNTRSWELRDIVSGRRNQSFHPEIVKAAKRELKRRKEAKNA